MGLRETLVNRILPQNYYLTRALYSAAFAWKTGGKTPLLVYQMGKVGSSTIVATLKAGSFAGSLAMPLFHIHSLTAASIEADERFYFGDQHGLFRPSGWPNTVHLFTSHYLHRRLAALKGGGGKWKIITLVREPVARNISGFFESIEYRIANFYPRLESGDLTMQEMTEHFVNRYSNHDVPLRWFDDEMKVALDVDVFATPFPHEQGYAIYRSAKADVLLLRLESLSNCANAAFREFLGIDQVELINANDARDKAYYPTYRSFVKSVSLPDAYLRRMYDSKYMRHFYTNSEIERFQAQWKRGQSS